MGKIKFFLFVIIVFSISTRCYAENVKSLNITVPVIMYHKISDNIAEHNEYCISSHKLESDFEEIKKAGFTPITVSEYKMLCEIYKKAVTYTGINNEFERKLKEYLDIYKNPILITIDDGYKDGYTIIYPLLKKYGFKANMSIVGSYVENSSAYLDAAEIKEMYESGLVEFGNHTYEIHNYDYSELQSYYDNIDNSSSIQRDYEKNEQLFIKQFGIKPSFFSYPYGLCSEYTERILSNMGYDISFVTCLSADMPKLGSDYRKISRINRVPQDESKVFVKKIIDKIRQQDAKIYMPYRSLLNQYYLNEKNHNLNTIIYKFPFGYSPNKVLNKH